MNIENSNDVNIKFIDSLFFKKFCSISYIVVCGLAIVMLDIHFLYVLSDMIKRLMDFYTRPWVIISTVNNWFIPYVIIPALFFGYLLFLVNLSADLVRIFLRQLKKLTGLLKS